VSLAFAAGGASAAGSVPAATTSAGGSISACAWGSIFCNAASDICCSSAGLLDARGRHFLALLEADGELGEIGVGLAPVIGDAVDEAALFAAEAVGIGHRRRRDRALLYQRLGGGEIEVGAVDR